MTITTNATMPSDAADAGVPLPRRPADQPEIEATPQIDLHVLRDSLTPAQRNGRACVRCGTSDHPLNPAGTLLNVAVVECDLHSYDRWHAASPAMWLAISPCPKWCDGPHSGTDHPVDREHSSTYLDTVLHSMPYDNYGTDSHPAYKSSSASMSLIQHYLEGKPRVCFADTSDKASYYMTLDEAEKIAFDLLTLVAAGRSQGAVGGIPERAEQRAGCWPWCSEHDDCTCKSDSGLEAWLTHCDCDGFTVWFDKYGGDGIALSEAEGLVRAILRLVILARQSENQPAPAKPCEVGG